MTFLQQSNDCTLFLFKRSKNFIIQIPTLHRNIGWDGQNRQLINILKFSSLGFRRPCHSRQLGVHAKIVLKGDRGQGLILGFYLYVLFGFQRLVQTI